VSDPRIDALIDAAARPFNASGRFAMHFARTKLRHDPVYLSLLRDGLIPDHVRLLDLGCGQGTLLALLLAAREQYRCGAWPDRWPAPPEHVELHGIELGRADVRRARLALGGRAAIEQVDLRYARIAPSDVIVLLDVLHYLEADVQERLLSNVARALTPGGRLIARVGDAAGGFTSLLTRAVDRVVCMARGWPAPRWRTRSVLEWIRLLEQSQLRVSAEPMSRGTPFANVLLVALRPHAAD